MCLAKFNCPQINLKLLVSCFNEVRHLDLFNHTSKVFFQPPLELRQTQGKKVHTQWGITWNEKSIYITSTPVDINDKKSLKSLILELDVDGNLIRELFPKISNQPHQLQYYKGYLFLVDTGHNCIKIIDCNTCEYNDLIPFAGRFGSDIDHINALSINDDKLYISALNGSACIYNLNGKEYHFLRRFEFVRGIHNIFILDDKICTNVSDTGDIIDEYKNKILSVGPYNRGIVITDKYILVGQSAVSLRDRRGANHMGAIMIFDRSTKNIIGKIILPEAGQVLEIRCLNQEDCAHHGKPLFSD